MRLSIYFLTLVFLSSCTTIEVGREVVKVGAVVKDKVEETITKKEPEIIEDKSIVEELELYLDFIKIKNSKEVVKNFKDLNINV